MQEYVIKAKAFLKQYNAENAAIVVGLLVVVFLVAKYAMPKSTRRKRRTSATRRRSSVRRASAPANTTKSVTGANLRVPRGKKPWQVKGSLAARRRMAQIRRKRK